MPINKTESLIYTKLMCIFMVYFMSVYNIMLVGLGLSIEAFALAWNSLPLAILVAFILDVFVVSTPAKKLAFKIITPAAPSWKKITLISSFMVLGMVVFMSLFGAILHTGLSIDVFKAWMLNIPKNLIFALPLQLLIAGPVVRKIFRFLFPIGSIQDIDVATLT